MGAGLGASGLRCGCSLVPGRCRLDAGSWAGWSSRRGLPRAVGPVQFHWCGWASEGTGDAAGQGHRRARGVREPPRPRWASLAGWKGGQVCGVPRCLPTSSRLRGEHGARASSDQAQSGCRTAGSSGSCSAGPQSRCRPSALAGTLPARSPGVTGQGHTSQAFADCGLWGQAGSHVCLPVALPAAHC